MEFKYKTTKKCSTCKYLMYRPKLRAALVNEVSRFNPQGGLTMKDFHRKYALPTPYVSLMVHCNKHIVKIENKVLRQVSDKTPLRKVMGELVVDKPGLHEAPLKAYISQFNEKVAARELPITVKDGLNAIKIMADIESKKRDDKKDILKIMSGAYEPGRPTERT